MSEIKEGRLTQIALFLSPLCELKEREKVYRLLNETKVSKIPVVHLNSKMLPEEIEYLIGKYHTEAFNLHSQKEFKQEHDFSAFKDKIYIENQVHYALNEEEIKEYAGVCCDFLHLYQSKINFPNIYQTNFSILSKYKIGFNHISVYKPGKKDPAFNDPSFTKEGSGHYMTRLDDLNYLKEIPTNLFSKYLAIELENSIKDQFQAEDYIVKLLADRV